MKTMEKDKGLLDALYESNEQLMYKPFLFLAK